MMSVSSGTQRMEFGEHGYMNLVPGKLPGHTEIENEKWYSIFRVASGILTPVEMASQCS